MVEAITIYLARLSDGPMYPRQYICTKHQNSSHRMAVRKHENMRNAERGWIADAHMILLTAVWDGTPSVITCTIENWNTMQVSN